MVAFGASRAVPALKPKGPLWVQTGDLRRDARQRAQRADSSHLHCQDRTVIVGYAIAVIRTTIALQGGGNRILHGTETARSTLLDHLVGATEDRERDSETKYL
jgi:hypothetical protein